MGSDERTGLLRVATAGSVDDGKSTLIGRLLWDSKSLLEDQVDAVAQATSRRGQDGVNLAMFTDGLRDERERGITIDVAYRYFATPRRRFVLADTPGHVEYTRNMVTGASNADVAVVLVDVRHGVVEQTRRHLAIAGLLRVPHVVVAVNKMDLSGWDANTFSAITDEIAAFSGRLDIADLAFVPVSALLGDNVVERSPRMPWYEGPPLLRHLEDLPAGPGAAGARHGARLAVQWVMEPAAGGGDGPGYAGQVTSGVFRVGDDVIVLPSGVRSSVAAVEVLGRPTGEAHAGMAVTLRLADDVDVGRGDLVCGTGTEPRVAQEVGATVCWLGEQPLRAGRRYWLKNATRWCRATVAEVVDRLDIEALERHRAPAQLAMNDLGTLRLRLSSPLAFDPYRASRATGSFILVDQDTNATVAAGMLGGGGAGEERGESRGQVAIVGAGPGDPGLLTVRGRELLDAADVVVYDRLVDPALVAGRAALYVGKGPGRHAVTQEEINALLVRLAGEGKRVVRLKGGDPFVFGRGGEEVGALAAAEVPYEIVPGVTSAIGGLAAAGIPVTDRRVASSVALVTGHCGGPRPVDWEALATAVDTVVVLMGVGDLEEIVARLVAGGRDPATPAAVVEEATTQRQRVLTAPLVDLARRAREAGVGAPALIVVGEVVALRQEAGGPAVEALLQAVS